MAYMSRPGDFTGFISVVSGASATIPAADWNSFNQKLIDFAKYKKKGQEIGEFQTVYSQDDVTATIYNRTVVGLNVLSTYITKPIPTTKSSGQDLYASYIQALKTALNSIV